MCTSTLAAQCRGWHGRFPEERSRCPAPRSCTFTVGHARLDQSFTLWPAKTLLSCGEQTSCVGAGHVLGSRTSNSPDFRSAQILVGLVDVPQIFRLVMPLPAIDLLELGHLLFHLLPKLIWQPQDLEKGAVWAFLSKKPKVQPTLSNYISIKPQCAPFGVSQIVRLGTFSIMPNHLLPLFCLTTSLMKSLAQLAPQCAVIFLVLIKGHKWLKWCGTAALSIWGDP